MKHSLMQRVAEEKASSGNQEKISFCKKDVKDAMDGNSDTISFKFKDGTVVEMDLNKVSEENKRRAFVHGISQKVGDSFAGVKGNVAEGIAYAQDTINLLYSPDWTEEREGGGPQLGELAEAISEIRGVPLEKVRAVVEAAKPEERSAWRSNATVKTKVAEIRLRKAQANLQSAGQQELSINLG